MHMADALISPATGGAMWVVSAGLALHAARKLRNEITERKVPLMGVMGAFVFAAQMINFSIPGTGSSGHLAGGLLLAALLGPHAAYLVMFSILTVQALFFGDGGLLALGCNVFNMGFWACLVVYPFIFRRIAGNRPGWSRLLTASLMAAVLALQMGAFSVVLETRLSGISELPFGKFLLLMQPIHLAIGIVEGLVTAALLSFVWKARPEVLDFTADARDRAKVSLKPVLIGFGAAAVITGGLLSWFASTHPDGLEWSMFRTSGREELAAPADGVHRSLSEAQKKTALMPDYEFPRPDGNREESPPESALQAEHWPAVKAGTSLAGLVGSAIVLALAGLVGLTVRLKRRRS